MCSCVCVRLVLFLSALDVSRRWCCCIVCWLCCVVLIRWIVDKTKQKSVKNYIHIKMSCTWNECVQWERKMNRKMSEERAESTESNGMKMYKVKSSNINNSNSSNKNCLLVERQWLGFAGFNVIKSRKQAATGASNNYTCCQFNCAHYKK